MIDEALRALSAGLSVIPIVKGTKRSAVPWENFQTKAMEEAQVRTVFTEDGSMAAICGAVSGNLEVIDFDIPGKKEGVSSHPPAWGPFKTLAKAHGQVDLIKRLVIVQTPSGGIHLLYRCPTIGRNQKLAMTQKLEVMIETRGEGGYFLTWPTPGYCVKQGSIFDIPTITEDEREFLLTASAHLTEKPLAEAPANRQVMLAVKRPGDAYNEQAAWEEVLPAGWQRAGRSGSRVTWTRPGKKIEEGISATTGNGDGDLLYMHTSNAHPFEPGTSYSKFAVYALLHFGNDFIMAAKALSQQGYAPKDKGIAVQDPKKPLVITVKDRPVLKTKTFGEDFVLEVPKWRVPLVLPEGKALLVDADGGVGKSSFSAAAAAWWSNGFDPITGTEIEPVKTLYLHKQEDSSEEINTIYRANGGNFQNFSLYDGQLLFDDEGVELVGNTIADGGFGLVVCDAFFYFLLGLARDTNDQMAALRVMERWNAMLADTRATGISLRHTRKDTVDTDASALGLGTVQYRNSHRGQFVLRWHPEKRKMVCAESKKDSMLYQLHPFFAFQRYDCEVRLSPNERNPFDKSGDPSDFDLTKMGQVKQLLRDLYAGQWWPSTAIFETLIKDYGMKKRTIEDALSSLGSKSQKLVDSNGEQYWARFIPEDAI